MTEEQYSAAGKLLDELHTLKKAKEEIEQAIRRRNNQLNSNSNYRRFGSWLNKRFAELVLNAEKLDASLTVHHEFAKPTEIPVDQEFVSMVVEYLDKRIEEKSTQLSEL